MADSYQDFLDLAKQYNVDLTNNMSGIVPLLQGGNTELETVLNEIVPQAERSNLLKELQDAIDKGSEQSLKDMILKNVDSDDKNIKDIAVDKIIQDSNIDIKDIPDLNKTEFVDGEDLTRPNKLNKFDITDFFGNIFDFYKKYGAIGSGTPISDEALSALVNEGKLTGSPEARPSIREDAKKIITEDTDEAVVTSTDSKSDDTKKVSTDGGQGAAMGEAAKALAALTKMEDSKKEENSKSKKEEDDKPKGLKDYIRKAFEDPEAIMAFGRALVEGRGVSGGLEEYSEEREAGKKEQAALDTAAAELAFEKQKAEVDALYKAALAEQALGAAAKSKMGTKEIQNAQVIAAQAGKPGTLEYNQAFAKAMQDQITAKDDSMDFGDTLKLLALTGQLTPEKLKQLYPQGTGEQLTTDGQGNIIFAEGV